MKATMVHLMYTTRHGQVTKRRQYVPNWPLSGSAANRDRNTQMKIYEYCRFPRIADSSRKAKFTDKELTGEELKPNDGRKQ